MRFFSKETAVFTQHVIILIAVTSTAAVCTCVGHAACALVGIRRGGPSPVRHLNVVTWDPPSIWVPHPKEGSAMTFVLDKLLTIRRDVQKTKQLCTACQACYYVMNITYIASWAFRSIDQSPGFTVVTDNCHANSVLVSHVTMNSERFVTSFSIRVYNIAACGLWTVQFYFTACFSCNTQKEEEEEENILKNVKQLFDISNVIIKNENR